MVQFGIQLGDRPEQLHRLVDEMAAEVIQQTAALTRVTALAPRVLAGLGSVTLLARFIVR